MNMQYISTLLIAIALAIKPEPKDNGDKPNGQDIPEVARLQNV
jgi:hypothetical protein